MAQARGIACIVMLLVAGCAGMMKAQQEEEARKAQREALIREARSACYEAVKRDDLAGVVYDVLTGRRYRVTTAIRGAVGTDWLEEGTSRSKVDARVEEGRTETCKVVTLVVAAEIVDTGSGNWMPAAPAVARDVEDDLYFDIHTRAKDMGKAPAAPAPATEDESQ